MTRMFYLILIFFPLFAKAQPAKPTAERPALVVGIVVDQMRGDYLYRYRHLFSETGFKRILREGFSAENHHYSYIPTYTGPGHATIFTGTTPSVHGIIANDWFDMEAGAEINCTQDTSVVCFGMAQILGASPRRLMTTTITDELRLSTNYRAKVIGVSLKDRGAILPAGHVADAAYWFADNGKFISSTYYMDSLPEWVSKYNASGAAESYVKIWEPLLPVDSYRQSYPADDNDFEGRFEGETTSAFPHNLPELMAENDEFKVLHYSPFGNALVFDFAREAVENEALGSDSITDFLTVSLSAPDYVGHRYGIRSMELEDLYARLDRQLADFVEYLDQKVGRDNYLLFLTSDHGGADNPFYAAEHQLPGGYYSYKELSENLAAFMNETYDGGSNFISFLANYQVFLDEVAIKAAGLNKTGVAREIASYLQSTSGVYSAWAAEDLVLTGNQQGPVPYLQRGYYPGRSGDVLMVLNSGWHGRKKGTTHGSAFSYDTHVPLLLFGWKIKPGKTYRNTEVRDLAVTLALMLNISQPSGSTGAPILEVLE